MDLPFHCASELLLLVLNSAGYGLQGTHGQFLTFGDSIAKLNHGFGSSGRGSGVGVGSIYERVYLLLLVVRWLGILAF